MVVEECWNMCSKEEKMFRRKNNLVHRFETGLIKNGQVCFPAEFVKEYRRPAAGRNTFEDKSSLRSPRVLLSTVNYLLRVFDTLRSEHFGLVYSFVSDRLRAVRQDMIIQAINHISYEMVDESILVMYILHKADDTDILVTLWSLRRLLRSSWDTVSKLMIAYKSGYYSSFFKKLNDLKQFEQYAAVNMVFDIRVRALHTIATAYKSTNGSLPYTALERWMGLNRFQIEKLLSSFGEDFTDTTMTKFLVSKLSVNCINIDNVVKDLNFELCVISV